MNLKSFTMLVIPGLLASSFAYASPAPCFNKERCSIQTVADLSNSAAPTTAAPTDNNVAQPMQPAAPADNNTAPSMPSAPADTNVSPSMQPPAPADNNSSTQNNETSDDAVTPDTATGDDDY